MKTWSWVKSGIALGLLSIIAVFLVKPLGASTEYVVTDGIILKLFSPDFVANSSYFSKYINDMGLSYGMMVIFGMLIGAVVSMLTGGMKVNREEKSVPEFWKENFGKNAGRRYMQAFIGGFLLLFGARLADGCTSGHIISGMSQLSISGFIFAAAVFAAGIPTAKFIYRGRKGAL